MVNEPQAGSDAAHKLAGAAESFSGPIKQRRRESESAANCQRLRSNGLRCTRHGSPLWGPGRATNRSPGTDSSRNPQSSIECSRTRSTKHYNLFSRLKKYKTHPLVPEFLICSTPVTFLCSVYKSCFRPFDMKK